MYECCLYMFMHILTLMCVCVSIFPAYLVRGAALAGLDERQGRKLGRQAEKEAAGGMTSYAVRGSTFLCSNPSAAPCVTAADTLAK